MKYLTFDCETHNSGLEYSMPPEEFVRLFQYQIDDEPVKQMPVETLGDLEICRDLIREAKYVVGHNIISADLGWIFGPDSLEPLHMGLNRKILDTFVIASIITPAPNKYTAENGHTFYDADKPGTAMKWLSLANLCYQFGIPGKLGDLTELAKKYNPPKTLKKDLDYSLIPLDDPEFQAYADQDVVAGKGLFKYLMAQIKTQNYSGEYVWRELEIASAVQQMSRNGILVDQEWAHQRIANLAVERDEAMKWLIDTYDFPQTGKSPWASAKGKEVILEVLAANGVTEKTRTDWPRTPTGSLKLGGEDLLDLTEGTGAEEFAEAVATLKSQRSTAQLVLDSTHPDGRVHPSITSLQRSGRWSLTRPGVTVFGSREGRDLDKDIFIASEGKVMAGFDFSNADPRAMAALSGDPEFCKQFIELDPETGKPYDGHNLTGEMIFGKEQYYGTVGEDGKPALRPISKAAKNALGYNIGPRKLAETLNKEAKKYGIDRVFSVADAKEIADAFNSGYPWLKSFKDRAAQEGDSKGYVENSWGRRMAVPPGRSWTASPALYGQSSVRELMADAILRLVKRDDYYARSLRAIIHDELLVELDEDRLEEDIRVIKECMEVPFEPDIPTGTAIDFPVGVGYGRSWREAGH